MFHKALITGIAGSGGSYLAEYILENHPETEVIGFSRWHSTTQDGQWVPRAAKIFEVDLQDFVSIVRALKECKPDVIFHLAAHANVAASFLTPNVVLSNNILGTVNLLEAVNMLELGCVIQICSSSKVYGQVLPDEVPIKETNPIRATSPYAVSKLAQDFLGLTYANMGMKIVRTRGFSYINPRRADIFSSSFARQIARIECGLQANLMHGNLESIRTLLDVRDMMAAYWTAAEKCSFGDVYNIGGTNVVSVGEFLDKLIEKASKDTVVTTIQWDSLMRPTDITLQIPDVSKFYSLTKWKPRYSLDESIDFLLDYWRKKAKEELLRA